MEGRGIRQKKIRGIKKRAEEEQQRKKDTVFIFLPYQSKISFAFQLQMDQKEAESHPELSHHHLLVTWRRDRKSSAFQAKVSISPSCHPSSYEQINILRDVEDFFLFYLADKTLQLFIFDYSLCLIMSVYEWFFIHSKKTFIPFNQAQVHKLGGALLH